MKCEPVIPKADFDGSNVLNVSIMLIESDSEAVGTIKYEVLVLPTQNIILGPWKFILKFCFEIKMLNVSCESEHFHIANKLLKAICKQHC